MLNVENVKFENKEDFYKIVDMVAKGEGSPIILLSTSEAAREFFIQELTVTLLENIIFCCIIRHLTRSLISL